MDVEDPASALERLLGKSSGVAVPSERNEKPATFDSDIAFDGLSLQDYAKRGSSQSHDALDEIDYSQQSVEQCMFYENQDQAQLLSRLVRQMRKSVISSKTSTSRSQYVSDNT